MRGAGQRPAVRGRTVARPWLFERLERAARVTQVVAPAGSGKTFLLSSWVAECGRADSTAWVAVQDRERDLQQFWISVADALRDTTPGSKRVRPLTVAPDLDGWAVERSRALGLLAPLPRAHPRPEP